MRQRLVRILVYDGESSWINACITSRGVKGSYTVPNGTIREAIIGDFLEVIPPDETLEYAQQRITRLEEALLKFGVAL